MLASIAFFVPCTADLKSACGARAHTEPLSDLLFTPEALFTICYTGQVQRSLAPVPVTSVHWLATLPSLHASFVCVC